MENYIERAIRAWFRSGAQTIPSSYSCVHEYKGKQYVVLDNCHGVLAVYRIQRNGILRRCDGDPDGFKWINSVNDRILY